MEWYRLKGRSSCTFRISVNGVWERVVVYLDWGSRQDDEVRVDRFKEKSMRYEECGEK